MTPLDSPPPSSSSFPNLLALHQGRLGRLSYIAWLMILICATFIGSGFFDLSLGLLSFALPEHLLDQAFLYVFSGLNGIWFLISTYFALVLIIRRLHDTNHSGWWSLLTLLPFANVVLFFYLVLKAGDPQINPYGAVRNTLPLEKVMAWLGILMWIMLAMFLLWFIYMIGHMGGAVLPSSLPEMSDYF